MNDDDLSTLFAPAHERPLPVSWVSVERAMTDGGRKRQQRRALESAAVVAVLGVGILGAVTFTHASTDGTVVGAPASTQPTGGKLTAAAQAGPLSWVSLPPGAKPVHDLTTSLLVVPGPNIAGAKHTTGFWDVPGNKAWVYAWLTAHPSTGFAPGQHSSQAPLSFILYSTPTDVLAAGLTIQVSVADVPGGSQMRIDTWQLPTPTKVPAETLNLDQVRSVVVKELPATGSSRSRMVSADEARQLAAAINDAPVLPTGIREVPCTAGATNVSLTFSQGGASETFDVNRNCHIVSLRGATGAAGLVMTPRLSASILDALGR